MAIDVTCPAGHSFKVKRAFAGRSGRCPHCGETVIVPAEPTLRSDDRQSAKGLADSKGSGSELLVIGEEESPPQAAPESKSAILRTSVKRLGRFELIEVVGTGGFGTVFRARDPQLDRDVALKVPRSGALADDADANRFLREAKASAQLRHPNIVAVYEAGQIDGTYFIAAGFVEGTTLRQAIKDRGAFPQREAATLVAKLASALHYAHGKGIVHRDVKPANAMLDSAGEPHIMDFGLARRDEGDGSGSMEGMILGTPAYMSPEQAQGRGHQADARSDLWSLGVVLYELLTGQKPFSGGDTDVMIAVRVRDPDPPRKLDRTIPRDLETICLKCLAKSPDGRYANCQELADELERWLRGDPIQARRISPVERFGRWARRNPAVATLATVAALLLLAVVGDQFVANRRLQHSQEQIRLALAQAESAADAARAQTEVANKQRREADDARQELAEIVEQLGRAEAARKQAEADAAAAAQGQDQAQQEVAAARTAQERLEQERLRALDLGLLLGYIERLHNVQQSLESGDDALALSQLDSAPKEYRGWEWGHLRRSAQGGSVDVVSLGAFESAGPESTSRIAFDRRGSLAAICARSALAIVDSLKPDAPTIIELPGSPIDACFLPGSKTALALTGKGIMRCDIAAETNEKTTFGRFSPVAFQRVNDRQVVVALNGKRGLLELFDADTREKLASCDNSALSSAGSTVLAIAPDFARLAVLWKRRVSLIEMGTGQVTQLRFANRSDEDPVYRDVSPWIAAFSPDGGRFAMMADRELLVCHPTTGISIPAVEGDYQWLADAAAGEISPDGRRGVEVRDGGAVVVWDLATGRDLLRLDLELSEIVALRFGPEGRRLWAVCRDGTCAILMGENPTVPPIAVTEGADRTGTAREQAGAAAAGMAQPDPPPLAIAPFDAVQAKKSQIQWARHLRVPVEYENSLGMKFRLIPPGEYAMGSNRKVPCQARITRRMYAAVHETTVAQFRAFIDDTGHTVDSVRNPALLHTFDANRRAFVAGAGHGWDKPGFPQDDKSPVCCVSWGDANAFCRWLSERWPGACRLPTEAEWEYLARAGVQEEFLDGAYNGTGDFRLGNVADQSLLNLLPGWQSPRMVPSIDGYALTAPVGSFQPNAFGLCDVVGNVSEWCQDWYAQDSLHAGWSENPTGPSAGNQRVVRGDAWNSVSPLSTRLTAMPEHAHATIGFRVVMELEPDLEDALRNPDAPDEDKNAPQESTSGDLDAAP